MSVRLPKYQHFLKPSGKPNRSSLCQIRPNSCWSIRQVSQCECEKKTYKTNVKLLQLSNSSCAISKTKQKGLICSDNFGKRQWSANQSFCLIFEILTFRRKMAEFELPLSLLDFGLLIFISSSAAATIL